MFASGCCIRIEGSLQQLRAVAANTSIYMNSQSHKRIRRGVARAIGIIGSVAIIGACWVFGASEWKLRRVHDVPLVGIRDTAGSPDPAEGERMARIVGCWSGCHGDTGQGGQIDMEGYYRVTAPTLSSVLPLYSDAELVRLVRFGVKRDGSTLLGMTSYTFFPLGDEDLANIIVHLRRQPLLPAVPRERAITWTARLRLAQGKWQVAADQIDPARPRWGELPRTSAFERGRYLASITCTECHGLEFRGNEFNDNTYDGGPSLAIVAIYDRDAFRELMRTGKSVGGRDLGEMAWVARNGFVHFKEGEIDDIRAFLRTYHGLPEDEGDH